MELRNLQTAGKSVAQMREEIRTHLKAEGEMKELIDFISEESTRSEVMEHIIQYVPCILHAENLCGIIFLRFFSSRDYRMRKVGIFLMKQTKI